MYLWPGHLQSGQNQPGPSQRARTNLRSRMSRSSDTCQSVRQVDWFSPEGGLEQFCQLFLSKEHQVTRDKWYL